MTSSKKAEKPTSSYKIGDRTVAQAYWNGNDYVTKFNPTEGESQSMNYLQSAIPLAYADATNNATRDEYKNTWINNQTKQLNELADENMTKLKDSLITGGQVGGSTGWNKIGKFSDSYMDALNDINANADLNALNYQNALLGYANNLQGSMNNYYNLGNSSAQTAAANQQNAANQNLQYTAYNNSIGNQGLSNVLGGINSIASLAGGIGTLGSGIGALKGGLSAKTGG